MILFPAIDIKDGQAVRLKQGRMDDADVFNVDPADQAAIWTDAGFEWIHVVDLDGAVSGEGQNAEAVRSILWATTCKVQLGGGVRTRAHVDTWIDAGVQRVVLGTAAVRHPDLVREAAAAYPSQIVIAVDVRDGRVAVEGWVEQTDIDAVELARRFEDVGVGALMVTDIARDGLGLGVNVELTGRMADAVAMPVIASGGIASLADIHALKRWREEDGRAKPIAGAIIGRALYDGSIDPKAALAAADGPPVA